MSSPDGLIRVLLVDDHRLFLEGLQELLAGEPEIAVIGTAATAAQGLAAAVRLLPDVVVLDLHLPDVSGVEVTRRLALSCPRSAVLILTMYDDDRSLFAAMRAGARGYVLKGCRRPELVAALRSVSHGDAVFGAPVADRVLAYLMQPPAAPGLPLPELTVREREVLGLLASGQPTATIARRLGVTAKTVRNHLSNIFGKLQVVDRTQAVLRTKDAGL